MKRLTLAVAGSLMLILMSVGFAAAQDGSFSGEIMDSSCAKAGSHDGMMQAHTKITSAKQCTLGCVKGGAKFVLYDASTKTVYALDDQMKPVDFAGAKVTVTGSLDKATNTIHVADIKAAS
jgi:type 1 fimbria pilin